MVAINIAAITILSAVIHCALVSGVTLFFTVSALCLESLKTDVSNLISIGMSLIGLISLRQIPSQKLRKMWNC